MGILYILTWEMSTFSNYNNPQSNELVVKFPNEIENIMNSLFYSSFKKIGLSIK